MLTKAQQQVIAINAIYGFANAIGVNNKDGIAMLLEISTLLSAVSDFDGKQATISELKALESIKDIFDKAQACSAANRTQH